MMFKLFLARLRRLRKGSFLDPRTRRSRGLKSSISDLLHDMLLVSNGQMTISLSKSTMFYPLFIPFLASHFEDDFPESSTQYS